VDIVKRLARTTDVLVENFRPGVMQRLGLDYPELVGIQPALIFCAISGYGQSGPSARLPAYAPVIHAVGGYDVAHLSYQEGRTKPDNNVSSSPMCSAERTPSAPSWPQCTSASARGMGSSSTCRCWKAC
jgi:CoA-transferase family III